MKNYVRKFMRYFPDSFINYLNELIIIDKTNLYFGLDNVKNELEFKVKILEICSRAASKAMPYMSERRNKKYQNEIREKINKYLGINLSREDMEIIYQELGNGVNHELARRFVKSGYDIDMLINYETISKKETVENTYTNTK